MINKQRLLHTFLEYVQIDSESGYEGAMCSRIERDMDSIGLSVTPIERTQGPETNGKTLMIHFKGQPAAEPLILCAHLDTVTPGCQIEPVLTDDGYIQSRGETILGADDKSGVAAIVEALRTISEKGLSHRTVQIFFTIGEEIGLLGSRSISPELLAARHAVILDTSKDVGRIVTSAPGQIHLEAFIHGIAAHAGNAPEKGVSAILVAAEALSHMKLQRIDHETTANIGTFEAIGSTNTISPEAHLIFEARSRDNKKLEAQGEHMIQCLEDACRKMGGHLEYELTSRYKGYQIPDQNPLVEFIFSACRSLGITPYTAATGGGSDANILNQYGITAVNIATGMENVHSVHEQISLENLQKIGKLALKLMII